MSEPLLIERQRTVLRDLVQLAAERAVAEKQTEAAFHSRTELTTRTFEETRQRLTSTCQAQHEATTREYQNVLQQVAARFESEQAADAKEIADTRQRFATAFEAEKATTESRFANGRWAVTTACDAECHNAEELFGKFQHKIRLHREHIETIRKDGEQALKDWLPYLKPLPEPSLLAPRPTGPKEHRLRHLTKRIAAAETRVKQARTIFLPKLMKGKRFLVLVLFCWLLALVPALWVPKWYYWLEWYYWLAGATGAALVVGGILRLWLFALTRRRLNHIHHRLCKMLAQAGMLCTRYQEQVTASHERRLTRIKKRQAHKLRLIEEKYRPRLAAIEERRQKDTMRLLEKQKRHEARIQARWGTGLREAEEKYPRLLAELKEHYDADLRQAKERHDHEMNDSKVRHDADRQALTRNWCEGLARVQAAVTEISQETGRLLPAWKDPAWQTWQPPAAPAPVIRFGEYQVGLTQIPQGIPQDPALKATLPERYLLPALLAFPGAPSLLIKATEEGRPPAEEALQLVMLRLLTAIPPAKVRFTIIDPVGLGHSFSAFMHLGDYEESLVSSRIWTEQQHIEQRLADLTEHTENVIQKYLRNQFQTIEEYNVQAGEVAEPFRFLVVANFPTNFTPEAAHRLVSIATSGARCGIFTLITVDGRQPLPQGFDLAELEQNAVILVWKDDRFYWQDRDFSKFPFRLDALPDAEFTTRILQQVGQLAKLASRVEVPFEFIAPPEDKWWTADSRSGIRVPLGRAGATKRQLMQLGQGTAQHVLIAGKTGSGKSTLLHALITNLALLYSPQEIEMYLVDFKEGVEFKPYATYELPHATLVAIESEREFGLSVLQRLEAELKQRGDLFRALGVQDLNGYRQANGQETLPRILLIVDEFQLFFIEDDKIAQDAALLLDRLVRQGRAFGIHVLLGSQTLGGAYSLARSTIGQMAVRIALQCSEADAHLILSEDNAAARLLSRPGEAIYNDANGLVEGNDFFQVVWLSDDQKEDYLARIRDRARRLHCMPARPQIVFEGKAPADVSKNHLLMQLLQSPAPAEDPRALHAWLGEAMAIKDPTAAIFRPQSGSNLLIIGQADEAALAIVTSAILSLGAQLNPAEELSGPARSRLYVLDGSPVDAPHAGYLPRLPAFLPQAMRVGGWRELPAVIEEVAAEVEARLKAHDGRVPALFLFVHGLQRFRDLRGGDEDFSFSRRGADEPPSPAKLFTTIMRDGPAVGVYTILWCDTMNNVNRTLDRQKLREFEMRVLFQMSAADSSNLIDSPLASKLGIHRALFYSEDRGQPEKFRPYGLPTEVWLASIQEQLRRGRTAPAQGAAAVPQA